MSNLSDDSKNQRRFPRKECCTGAVIFSGARVFMSEAKQVSQEGVLVSTPAPLNPGDQIRIQLVIGNSQVEATASVLYSLPGSKVFGTRMFGVRFDSISEQSRNLIEKFVTEDSEPTRKSRVA